MTKILKIARKFNKILENKEALAQTSPKIVSINIFTNTFMRQSRIDVRTNDDRGVVGNAKRFNVKDVKDPNNLKDVLKEVINYINELKKKYPGVTINKDGVKQPFQFNDFKV